MGLGRAAAALLLAPGLVWAGAGWEQGRFQAEASFQEAGIGAHGILDRVRLPHPASFLGESEESAKNYKEKIKALLEAYKDLPPVDRLPRPVLLLPGGKSQKKGLRNYIHYFTASGKNQFAGSFHIGRKEEFAAEVRRLDPSAGQLVFTLEFSRTLATLENDTEEIRQAIDLISELTGSKVDCLAESKTAVEARMYLHRGGDKIANLILLVPIIKGFPIGGELAWIAAHLPIKRIWSYELTDKESREVAKSWTSDIKIGPWVWNKHLHPLNTPENLKRERERVERLTVIAGAGHNIQEGQIGSGLPLPGLKGDRSVPLSHALLPSADEVLVFTGEYTLHPEMWVNPKVMVEVTRIFLEGTEGMQKAREAIRKAGAPRP